jgi:hypothetical protein
VVAFCYWSLCGPPIAGVPVFELRDNAADQIHSQAQKAISLPSLFNGMMGMKLWAGSQCRSQ